MSKHVAEFRSPAALQKSGVITETEEPSWLALVSEKVKSLNYGVVQIVVHDSRVVQVERTERHRFDVHNGA